MTELFYRLSDLRPPLGVLVRVIWDGRPPVEMARVAHPSTKRECWVYRDRDEGVVYLPLDARALVESQRRARDVGEPWAGWHTLKSDAPEMWAPRDPQRWSLPLPEPVEVDFSAPVRMVAERVKFGAVEEAEAADLAREMENEREALRAQGERADVSQIHVKQWWRDVSEIKYEPSGEVSLRFCEGRLMRALAWCGAEDGPGKMRVNAGLLHEIGEAAARALAELEAKGLGDLPPPSFKPLPQDRADFEVAMGWFAAINPPELWSRRRKPWSLSREQRVLLYRSRAVPLSYGEIGARLGWRGHQRAQQVFGEAVEGCWRAANGMPVLKTLKVKDQIAALRERNRAHRRGQGLSEGGAG